jgi:hypothetical protein
MEGIIPLPSWSIAVPEYITKTLQATVMLESGKRLFETPVEPGKPQGMLAYADSAWVREEAREITEAEAKKAGVLARPAREPMKILSQFGYSEYDKAFGLQKYINGGFLNPFVHESLKPIVEYLFDSPKPGGWDAFATRVMAVQNFVKSIIVVNPADSMFRFGANLVNLIPFREVAGSPITKRAFVDAPVVHPIKWFKGARDINKSMLRGQYKINKELYMNDNVIWAIQGGMQIFADRGYQAVSEHPADFQDMAYEQTAPTRWKKSAQSLFGVSAYVFDEYLAKLQMQTFNYLFAKFQEQGYQKPHASRKAASIINHFSNLLSPSSYGGKKHARMHQMLWFSRNMVLGPMSLVTKATYPLWAGMKDGIVTVNNPFTGQKHQFPWYGPTGLHKMYTGAVTGMFNPVLHGDSTRQDMEEEWQLFAAALGRNIVMKIALIGAFQWALSWRDDDDDEFDEHGERFAGIEAKKRYFWNNERGKRLMIRMPFKDMNNQRLYLDPQIFKETNDIFDVFIGAVDKKWGRGPGTWVRAKKHLFLTALAEALTGRDDFTGEEIAPKALQSSEMWLDYYKNTIGRRAVEWAIPLGLRPEDMAWLKESNMPAELSLDLIQMLGASLRRGVPVESGMLAEDVYIARDELAMKQYMTNKAREVSKGLRSYKYMTDEDRAQFINEYYSDEAWKDATIKRAMPGYSLIQQGALKANMQRQMYYQQQNQKEGLRKLFQK